MTVSAIILIFLLTIIAFCFISDPISAADKGWESKSIVVVATAYCLCESCCGKGEHDGKTSIGRNAYRPGIAVDPKIIPYRSRIDCAEYIRNPTWSEADDCGGAIKGHRIDLRFNDHQKAIEFGKKIVKIRVWSKT